MANSTQIIYNELQQNLYFPQIQLKFPHISYFKFHEAKLATTWAI